MQSSGGRIGTCEVSVKYMGSVTQQRFKKPQVSPVGQVPQLSSPPQPSAMLPQLAPSCTQVVGAQSQRYGVPSAPQLSGDMHPPQLSVPPHPSEGVPHSAPSAVQVVGSQGAVPH